THCQSGEKGAWLDPLKRFWAEISFLLSLVRTNGKIAPLDEDWAWVRSRMTALVELVMEFKSAFTEAKREAGSLDFHDLEQYSLRLLWDNQAGEPTPIARQWRDKLRFVFVD